MLEDQAYERGQSGLALFLVELLQYLELQAHVARRLQGKEFTEASVMALTSTKTKRLHTRLEARLYDIAQREADQRRVPLRAKFYGKG